MSFYAIDYGQDFANALCFIKDDGTVGSAQTEYGAVGPSGKIEIDNDLGYRNIVTIINGIFGGGEGGGHGPIFIDINGKIFSEFLK